MKLHLLESTPAINSMVIPTGACWSIVLIAAFPIQAIEGLPKLTCSFMHSARRRTTSVSADRERLTSTFGTYARKRES